MSVASSSDSLHPCFNSTASVVVSAAYNTARFLLLFPLSVFVLYLGCRRWRSFKPASHSDVFTYHNAVLQLVGVLAAWLFLFSLSFDLPGLQIAAYCCSSIMYFGENFIHVLTCVERYLAVVHPVTYLALRKARGVRIRNAGIAGAWLMSCTWTCVIILCPNFPFIAFFIQLLSSLLITSSCSLCVLWALIRPGPGDGGGSKEHVDQSKQRVFFTIMAIMGALWLWFLGFTVTKVVGDASAVGSNCAVRASGYWFSLPSSVVLPLLYLHRAGKLPCYHGNGRSR